MDVVPSSSAAPDTIHLADLPEHDVSMIIDSSIRNVGAAGETSSVQGRSDLVSELSTIGEHKHQEEQVSLR